MKSSLKLLVLVSGLLLAGHSAEAQINATWTGDAPPPNNTAFTDTLNWSGDTVPTGTATISTTATIDLPGVSTTLTGDVVVTGSVVINATTAGFTAATLQINNSGTLTLVIPTGGTFTVDGSAITSFIGGVKGTSGVLNLTGGGTFSLPVGTNQFGIGLGGTGTVNQTAGTFDSAVTIFIGGDAGIIHPSQGTTPGVGVYNISGASTLTSADLFIGTGSTVGGTGPTSGLLNINGGVVTVSDDVVLGANTIDTTGAVANTTGSIQQTAGTFTVSNEMDIGENNGSLASYAISGGTFTGNVVTIGDQAGATGTFSQSGSSIASATEINVGQSGNGTANLFAGQLGINTAGSLNIGNGGTSTGSMTQSGGTLTLNGTAALNVGVLGNGTYNQQGGLVTNLSTGAISIGNGGGNGTYNLSGGTLTSNGTFIVGGGAGTGTFTYSGGTLNYTNGMEIGSNGVFNQDTNFTPTTVNPQMTLDAGSVYNLNSGTLTIGGDMGTPNASGIFGVTGVGGASFNFAGGSVAPTGTDWTDGLNGSVTGNSTIDTASNNAILNGDLTGNGLITIIGNNAVDLNLTLGNSSAGSFGFHVESGSLFANAATFPSVGSITVDSTGTVNMAEHGTNALSGQISGAGAFQVNFDDNTDVLELTGGVDLTGTTTLATTTGLGTLQVTNGTFGDLTGAGSLIVANNGMVNLIGTSNAYTGSTTIDSGGTLLANSIGNVGGTGVLTNDGTLGSNATIGTTIGASTLTINGSYAASTGTLDIRMVALGSGGVNTDVFAIAGAANVGGTTFNIVSPQITTGTFTILTSTALSGSGALIQPSSNLFLHMSVVPDTGNANDLDLITATNTSASIPGLNLTPNEAAVAATLDSLINNNSGLSAGQFQNFSALLNRIGANGTSTSQLALNYEELTPQSLQYAQDIAYEHSAFLVSKVDGFDNALHHEFTGFDTSGVSIVLPGFNSDIGRQMQSMLAYDPSSWHQTAPNGVNYYPGTDDTSNTAVINSSSSPEPSGQVMSDSPTSAPMPMHTEPHSVTIRKPYSNFSAFIGGDGTIADLNQNQGASYAPSSKATYSAVDAIAGISYRMTSNLAAGVLFDYSHTDATTDGYGSKTKVDSYSPGVFATYGDKGFFINGLFAYGRNNYSNNRAIPVVGGIANSSPDGNQYTGALDAGYDLHIGNAWTITPSGGLTYTHLDVDGFTETGAEPADLNVQAQHDDSLRSRLGGSVSYATYAGNITLLPTFTAMWQHEFLEENAPITSSFNDFSSGAFTIHSVSQGRDSALIGVGLTAELNNTMAIFFECNADVNGNYDAENFVGGFKGSF